MQKESVVKHYDSRLIYITSLIYSNHDKQILLHLHLRSYLEQKIYFQPHGSQYMITHEWDDYKYNTE